MTGVRSTLQQLFRQVTTARGSEYDEAELRRSALVISPHFDDETLGCGALIIKKLKAGAQVAIVFMTDGGQSHSGRIDSAQLRAMRRGEGFAAATALGVPHEDVALLGFPELALGEYVAEAVDRLLALLEQYQPEHVFVPHVAEPLLWSADHQITTRVTLEAIRRYARPVTLYEYPIWYWLHWPWVPLRLRRPNGRRVVFANSLRYCFGIRGMLDFNCWLYSDDVEAQKRYALAQHRSQMQAPEQMADWPTLEGVAEGAFLRCFFQSHEFFRKTTLDACGPRKL